MSIVAVPKPPRREKKPRRPIAKSAKRIAKVNPERKAKRAVKAGKHYASNEYRAARKIAVERSGGQCEAIHVMDGACRIERVLLPNEGMTGSPLGLRFSRCVLTTDLQFHELHYGSDIGLLRDIRGVMLCEPHHAYIERTRHPTRSNGR